jgi:sulfite exporter TauE/SafE
LLLGALWGWLPCGLVYSALALAITQSSPWIAAGGMVAFGLGTLPVVLVAGIAAQQLTRVLQKRNIRMGLAVLIIIYGLWTIFGNLGGHSGNHHHSSEHEHQEHHHGMIDHSTMHHNHDTTNSDQSVSNSSQSSAPSSSHEHHHEHNHAE